MIERKEKRIKEEGNINKLKDNKELDNSVRHNNRD